MEGTWNQVVHAGVQLHPMLDGRKVSLIHSIFDVRPLFGCFSELLGAFGLV